MEFIDRNPIIYNICGKSGSGKSQIASFIEEYYREKGLRAISLQYSYYVKEYAKKILSWDGDESKKPRDFLNEVGVELIKNKVDPYFAVRRLLEDVMVYAHFYDCITVSDTRFEEEIIKLKEKFPRTITIHIKSDFETENLTEKQKKHSTNHGLDHFTKYDFEIENNGSLEHLKEKTRKLIEEVEKYEY